jgi:kynurenine formamidase
MRFRTFIVGYVLALTLFLFAQQRHTDPSQASGFRGVVDLTHAVNPDASRASRKSPTDRATEIDAPAAYAKRLWTVDQIPPERLVAPLVVLDVRQQAKANPDYQVSVEDIANWEKENGEIPLGAVVIARTGWESRWYSASKYRNEDRAGVMHFPGYSSAAAEFLVDGRKALGLGIDTPSVDSGMSKNAAVRNFTLAHGVYHLENVANLGSLPAKGGVIIVAPEKLQARSTGPVRLLALLR